MDDILDLPQYAGLYFDPATGRTYREDGSDTSYTFERASWNGPFGVPVWPFLNPISFASAETARRVLSWARGMLPSSVEIHLDERARIVGPFRRTPQRLLIIGGRPADDWAGSTWGALEISCGEQARQLIFQSPQQARDEFLAEVRRGGIAF